MREGFLEEVGFEPEFDGQENIYKWIKECQVKGIATKSQNSMKLVFW